MRKFHDLTDAEINRILIEFTGTDNEESIAFATELVAVRDQRKRIDILRRKKFKKFYNDELEMMIEKLIPGSELRKDAFLELTRRNNEKGK